MRASSPFLAKNYSAGERETTAGRCPPRLGPRGGRAPGTDV